jgi:hypothetical protein
MNLDWNYMTPNLLKDQEILVMLSLMQESYIGVTEISFRKDLFEKSKILLLKEKDSIVGFTTFLFGVHEFDSKKVRICFSGDTVISKSYRGSLSLPIYWGLCMYEELEKNTDRLYWLLTSKGVKTYRYLPVFFYKFVPSPLNESSELELLKNKIAKDCFKDEFDPAKGILVRNKDRQSIIDWREDEEYILRKKDIYTSFFYEKNRKFMLGEELVCLAEFSRDNIKKFIRKTLDGKIQSKNSK